jgi:ABC-type glycerol-3-phosphate transport system permease component
VVLTETPRAQTLTVGLAAFFGQYVRDWNGIMALSTLASSP